MKNVGFLKRMVVVVYDALLLAGVTMVAYGLLYGILLLTPPAFADSAVGKATRIIYLAGVSFAFYGWFWTHGGQTLGMKAWNLYVVDQQGKFMSWTQAAVRYVTAILSWAMVAVALLWADVARWYLTIGLGFTWILANKQNLAWHDMLSQTRILQIPKANKSGSKQEIAGDLSLDNSPNHEKTQKAHQ